VNTPDSERRVLGTRTFDDDENGFTVGYVVTTVERDPTFPKARVLETSIAQIPAHPIGHPLRDEYEAKHKEWEARHKEWEGTGDPRLLEPVCPLRWQWIYVIEDGVTGAQLLETIESTLAAYKKDFMARLPDVLRRQLEEDFGK